MAETSRLSQHLPWLGGLILLAIFALGAPLFSSETVLSDASADLSHQFLFARAFGFGEMAHGHLPLWNPYIYGGVPFLGDFQSALLYPLNLIFVVLPLATAINWSFGLHVMILGIGMYFWGLHRGLLRPAAFVAGVAAMFSGSFFLHIYAGHLSNVCAMAWVPVIFLGIDGWLAQRNARWIFLAAGAAALQIYAGHPQYVYFTALLAGIYSLAHLPGASRLTVAAGGLIAIYPLAALLAAAQLLPGLAAASESVRSGGVTYEFASMFSLPPENFFTLTLPWFYGGLKDVPDVPYWGSCYLWEMNVFAGTGVVLLACCGALRPQKYPIRLLVVLAVAALLALGAHTPLHRILYEILPGFSTFRGASKFIFFASLIVALLAGMGLDAILRKNKAPVRLIAYAGIVLGVIALAAGFSLQQSSGMATLRSWMALVAASKESYLNFAYYQNDAAAHAAQALAANSLLIFGCLAILFSGLLIATGRWPKTVWILVTGAVLELISFGKSSLATFPLKDFTYESVTKFLKETPGDYRVLNLINPDSSMLLRSENIWGYDPTVLRRYAELMSISQGMEPATASQYLQFSKPHPLLNLLRCRFAFVPKADGQAEIAPMGEPFPRFYLAQKYEVYPSPKALLYALQLSSHGLKDKVLLETDPNPKPAENGGKQEIKVLKSSTDSWTLDVTTENPAVLMMTDSYSKDWHARALPGSAQASYSILPADGAIRAIPLASGHHLITLEYAPTGFHLGLLLTILSLAGIIVCLAFRPVRERLSFSSVAAHS